MTQIQQNPNESQDLNLTGPLEESQNDEALVELSCVDFICQLEHLVSGAKWKSRGEHVENSAKLATNILNRILKFADDFLASDVQSEIQTIVVQAAEASTLHQQALDSRSWKDTLVSLLASDAVEERCKQTHQLLGKELAKACAAALFHTGDLVGLHSEIGRQIEQSTKVFVAELRDLW